MDGFHGRRTWQHRQLLVPGLCPTNTLPRKHPVRASVPTFFRRVHCMPGAYRGACAYVVQKHAGRMCIPDTPTGTTSGISASAGTRCTSRPPSPPTACPTRAMRRRRSGPRSGRCRRCPSPSSTRRRCTPPTLALCRRTVRQGGGWCRQVGPRFAGRKTHRWGSRITDTFRCLACTVRWRTLVR